MLFGTLLLVGYVFQIRGQPSFPGCPNKYAVQTEYDDIPDDHPDAPSHHYITPGGLTVSQAWHWPIHYEITDEVKSLESAVWRIEKAFNHIQTMSCAKFVNKKPENKSVGWIRFDNSPANCGTKLIGYFGPVPHPIELSPLCNMTWFIVHAILHVIGFEDEHNRPDRDEYIYINHQGIHPCRIGHFERATETIIDYSRFEYDPRSIMHYTITHFARYKKVGTMFPLTSKLDPNEFGYRKNWRILKPVEMMDETSIYSLLFYMGGSDVAKLDTLTCNVPPTGN